MQNKMFASHTFLVDMWMLTCIHTSQLRCASGPEVNYKHMYDTHLHPTVRHIYDF